MNTRDLIEYATLDLMGFLDERESAAYQEAFRKAPPAVQAQVRAAQLRVADDEARLSLPRISPPVGMRAKVVATVMEAINAMRAEPLARIGVGSSRSWINSAPLWRAACIGFATATLVLAGFGYKVSRDNRAIAEGSRGIDILDTLVKASDAKFPSLLANPKTITVAFNPTSTEGAFKPAARLYIDPEKKIGYLMLSNLPAAAGAYTIVVQSSPGAAATVLKQFEASPGAFAVPLDSIEIESVRGMSILSPATSPQARPLPLLVASDA